MTVDYLYQIPPISEEDKKEFCRHRTQPDTKDILLNKTHAIMSKEIFTALEEQYRYFPRHSGDWYVYTGRIWKHKDGDQWYLCWFGTHTKPNMCTNHSRKIIVL